MQDELWKVLERRFPSALVERERDHIDLMLTTANRRVLFELKSSTSARRAIRDALGQLLDYAFFEHPKEAMKLVIVGQGSETPSTKHYVKALSTRFRIPLKYHRYVVGSKRFNFS